MTGFFRGDNMKQAEYKVPGGKLVAVEVEIKDEVLSTVKITGDFFMHPESIIIDFEKTLEGIPLSQVSEVIHSFFKDNDVTLFGIEPLDFIHVLEMCLNTDN